MNPIEIDISTVTICTKVSNLERRTYDDNTKQTRTLAMICEQYRTEAWTNVYTYGSANNVIHDSGDGIAIYLPALAQKQPVQQYEDT